MSNGIQRNNTPDGLSGVLLRWMRIMRSTGYGVIDHFGYLAPGSGVAWAEGAVAVAGDHAVGVRGFHIAEEGVGGGHVDEGGCRGVEQNPTPGVGDYLAKLAAGDAVVGPEGAVAVA